VQKLVEKAVRELDRLLRDTRYHPTKRIAAAGGSLKDVFDKDYPLQRLDASGALETTAPYGDGGAYRTPKEVGAVYPHLVTTYGQQVIDEVFIPKFEEMLQNNQGSGRYPAVVPWCHASKRELKPHEAIDHLVATVLEQRREIEQAAREVALSVELGPSRPLKRGRPSEEQPAVITQPVKGPQEEKQPELTTQTTQTGLIPDECIRKHGGDEGRLEVVGGRSEEGREKHQRTEDHEDEEKHKHPRVVPKPTRENEPRRPPITKTYGLRPLTSWFPAHLRWQQMSCNRCPDKHRERQGSKKKKLGFLGSRCPDKHRDRQGSKRKKLDFLGSRCSDKHRERQGSKRKKPRKNTDSLGSYEKFRRKEEKRPCVVPKPTRLNEPAEAERMTSNEIEEPLSYSYC